MEKEETKQRTYKKKYDAMTNCVYDEAEQERNIHALLIENV